VLYRKRAGGMGPGASGNPDRPAFDTAVWRNPLVWQDNCLSGIESESCSVPEWCCYKTVDLRHGSCPAK